MLLAVGCAALAPARHISACPLSVIHSSATWRLTTLDVANSNFQAGWYIEVETLQVLPAPVSAPVLVGARAFKYGFKYVSAGCLADERICFHAELDHASDTGVTQGDNLAIYHGQLVIVKAYVADCINIDGTVAVMGSATQSSIALGTNGDFKHKQVILSICCWVSNCSVRSFLSLTMLSLCQNI